MLGILFACVRLLAAVQPAVTEPPALLSALANCSAVPAAAREWCIMRLVNGYARPGMTLEQLACLLDRPTWFEKRGLNYGRMSVAGWIPVGVRPGQTTLAVGVTVCSEGGRGQLWLRIAGPVDSEAVFRILRGEKSNCVEKCTVEAIEVIGLRF
jgi:hypothetical protein